MGKSNTSNSQKQQQSNESVNSQKQKKIKKTNRQGRPAIEKTKQNNIQPIEYWFQSEMANKIVRLLGSKGQIIFKCLSGQKAIKYKERLDDSIQSNLKNKRQDYLNKLNEQKKQLLDNLGQKQLFDNLGEKQENAIEYLFLGENEGGEEFNFSEHKELELLKGVIHSEFFTTFKEIVEKSKNEGSMPKDLSVNIVQNYQTYKMINNWALIKVLSEPYQENLEKLQIFNDEQSKVEFNEYIKDFLENQFNNDIQNMKKDFDKEKINDEQIKTKMTQIIQELLQGIQDIIYPSQQQQKTSNNIVE